MSPAIDWHSIPFDADDVPRSAPSCNDGEEILVRVDGEAVPVTCYRDHRGQRLVDDEGEPVDWSRVDAIAHRPRPQSRSGRTRTYAEKQAVGITRVSAELDAPTLAKLDALCDDGGMSRADMIRAMIDAEWAEWQGLITSGRKRIRAVSAP